VAGVTTRYWVDVNNPTGYAQVLQEIPPNNFPVQYYYGLDLLERYDTNNSRAVRYYVHDGHGSVRALTDSSGNVTDTYDYDAFGNEIHSTGTTPNNYLFAGEQYDPDLNLYYNRARYLNTSTGRFWSMDTYEGDDNDPLSLHKYAYTEDDPTTNLDLSGNEIDEVEAALSISMTIDAMPQLLFPAAPSGGSLQIDFKGENYTGLDFEHGSGVGGPFEDPGRGWFWNVAMKATLASGQDASQYRVKQTAVWTSSGNAYYGEGLQRFKRGGTVDPDDPLEGSYRANGNILYAIDGPGVGTVLRQRGASPGQGATALIDSVTYEEHFVTWIQKLTDPMNTKLFTKKWHVKIVVGPDARLDKSASDAGVDP
jgi:RHS repeat-associated protein